MRSICLLYLVVLTTVTLYSQEKKVDILKPLEPKGEYISPRNLEEQVKNFFMSKRFKKATSQRDSLYASASHLLEDTTKLLAQQRKLKSDLEQLENELINCNDSLFELNSNYKDLNKLYEAFKSKSSSQMNKLNAELDEKATQLELLEQELRAREKRVNELEGLILRQDSTMKAVNKAIKEALLQFNSSDLSVEMRNGKVYVSMNDKILFQSGKAKVQENGIVAISRLSDVLNKIANVEIMIEGHTDNIPIKTPQYQDNWDLSVARATAITRLMIEMGVKPQRITASGKAEFSPKASNLDAEGRSKNRRTEIVLIPNLDDIYKILNLVNTETISN